MKNYVILAAAAALVLGACSKTNVEVLNETAEEAIAFGVYTSKATTKAGAYGEATTTNLKTNGFGVFAQVSDNSDYAAATGMNFMYNTKVSGDSWTYSPIKYWPNQVANGNTDSQPATGYGADKVSFFAYAPYVAVTASTGVPTDGVEEGITALTANDATTDPKVSYKVSSDLTKQVDLLWGVASPTADVTWTNVAGGTTTVNAGMPFLNLTKPAIATPIKFYFKHALSQLKLTAVAAYNQAAAGGTAQDGVKITIKEVVVTVPGMPATGTLNLNNTTANTALWESVSGSSDLTLTLSGDNLNTDLKDGGDVEAANQPDGVTATEADVIVDGKYYTLLPKAEDLTVNVKITYYVTTDDANLSAGYSRVENVISKDVSFTGGLVAGTKNTIKMIIGISEVNFEAEVADWAVGTTASVDLPLNS